MDAQGAWAGLRAAIAAETAARESRTQQELSAATDAAHEAWLAHTADVFFSCWSHAAAMAGREELRSDYAEWLALPHHDKKTSAVDALGATGTSGVDESGSVLARTLDALAVDLCALIPLTRCRDAAARFRDQIGGIEAVLAATIGHPSRRARGAAVKLLNALYDGNDWGVGTPFRPVVAFTGAPFVLDVYTPVEAEAFEVEQGADAAASSWHSFRVLVCGPPALPASPSSPSSSPGSAAADWPAPVLTLHTPEVTTEHVWLAVPPDMADAASSTPVQQQQPDQATCVWVPVTRVRLTLAPFSRPGFWDWRLVNVRPDGSCAPVSTLTPVPLPPPGAAAGAGSGGSTAVSSPVARAGGGGGGDATPLAAGSKEGSTSTGTTVTVPLAYLPPAVVAELYPARGGGQASAAGAGSALASDGDDAAPPLPPAQGRFIVHRASLLRETPHCRLVDAEARGLATSHETGAVTRHGTFADVAQALPGLAAEGVTTLYLEGVADRDNGWGETAAAAAELARQRGGPALAELDDGDDAASVESVEDAFSLATLDPDELPSVSRIMARLVGGGDDGESDSVDGAAAREPVAVGEPSPAPASTSLTTAPSSAEALAPGVTAYAARPSVGPHTVIDRTAPARMLGGAAGFASLVSSAKSSGLRVVVHLDPHVAAARAHRKYAADPALTCTALSPLGTPLPAPASDGLENVYSDRRALNYRRLEAWELLIDEAAAWAAHFGVDGVYIPDAQSAPWMLPPDAGELYRRDADGAFAYGARARLEASVVLPHGEAGYWAITAARSYPNPLLVKLARHMWDRFPEFTLAGEAAWGRAAALVRSGLLPHSADLLAALAPVVGRVANKAGAVRYIPGGLPRDVAPVACLRAWLAGEASGAVPPQLAPLYSATLAAGGAGGPAFPDPLTHLLPSPAGEMPANGSLVTLRSLATSRSPYPAALLGRSAWTAVDVACALPGLPATLQDELEGGGLRVEPCGAYALDDGYVWREVPPVGSRGAGLTSAAAAGAWVGGAGTAGSAAPVVGAAGGALPAPSPFLPPGGLLGAGGSAFFGSGGGGSSAHMHLRPIVPTLASPPVGAARGKYGSGGSLAAAAGGAGPAASTGEPLAASPAGASDAPGFRTLLHVSVKNAAAAGAVAVSSGPAPPSPSAVRELDELEGHVGVGGVVPAAGGRPAGAAPSYKLARTGFSAVDLTALTSGIFAEDGDDAAAAAAGVSADKAVVPVPSPAAPPGVPPSGGDAPVLAVSPTLPGSGSSGSPSGFSSAAQPSASSSAASSGPKGYHGKVASGLVMAPSSSSPALHTLALLAAPSSSLHGEELPSVAPPLVLTHRRGSLSTASDPTGPAATAGEDGASTSTALGSGRGGARGPASTASPARPARGAAGALVKAVSHGGVVKKQVSSSQLSHQGAVGLRIAAWTPLSGPVVRTAEGAPGSHLAPADAIRQLAACEARLRADVGPEYGFNLAHIRAHYEHRRALRARYPLLREGGLTLLSAHHRFGEHGHVLAFARHGPGQVLVVAANFNGHPSTFAVDNTPLLGAFGASTIADASASVGTLMTASMAVGRSLARRLNGGSAPAGAAGALPPLPTLPSLNLRGGVWEVRDIFSAPAAAPGVAASPFDACNFTEADGPLVGILSSEEAAYAPILSTLAPHRSSAWLYCAVAKAGAAAGAGSAWGSVTPSSAGAGELEPAVMQWLFASSLLRLQSVLRLKEAGVGTAVVSRSEVEAAGGYHALWARGPRRPASANAAWVSPGEALKDEEVTAAARHNLVYSLLRHVVKRAFRAVLAARAVEGGVDPAVVLGTATPTSATVSPAPVDPTALADAKARVAAIVAEVAVMLEATLRVLVTHWQLRDPTAPGASPALAAAAASEGAASPGTPTRLAAEPLPCLHGALNRGDGSPGAAPASTDPGWHSIDPDVAVTIVRAVLFMAVKDVVIQEALGLPGSTGVPITAMSTPSPLGGAVVSAVARTLGVAAADVSDEDATLAAVLLRALQRVARGKTTAGAVVAAAASIGGSASAPAASTEAAVVAFARRLAASNRASPIVFVTPELGKWSTVGGLGVMVDELSIGLAELGAEVVCISPYYNVDRKGRGDYLRADGISYSGRTVGVWVGNERLELGVHEGRVSGVRVLFLHHASVFPRPYPALDAYAQVRVLVAFAKATLETLCQWHITPSLVVTNDWFTGLVPAYARHGHFGDAFSRTDFMHIAHNLDPDYEGRLWPDPGQGALQHLHGLPTHLLVDPTWDKIVVNPTRAALLTSDTWATVSRSYRADLLGSSPLRALLRLAPHPFAHPNGIPVKARLARLSSLPTPTHEAAKAHLQAKYFGFANPDPSIPLFAFVGRITMQKGVHLILQCVEEVLRATSRRALFLVGGMASMSDTYGQGCAHVMRELRGRYPDCFWADPSMFFTDGDVVNLGADFCLMPSMFEPGGIVQQEFFVAGTPVIAFKTGGLKDTVFEYDPAAGSGNGFTFEGYSASDFTMAIKRAVAVYAAPEQYTRLRANARATVMDLARVSRGWYREFHRLRRCLPPPPPKSPIPAAVPVRLTVGLGDIHGLTPSSVLQVTGSFNDWKARVGLTWDAAGAAFSATLLLPPGASYQYKFVADGVWTTSAAYSTVTDDKGNVNHVLAVPVPDADDAEDDE